MEHLGFCTVEQIEYAAKLNLALSVFLCGPSVLLRYIIHQKYLWTRAHKPLDTPFGGNQCWASLEYSSGARDLSRPPASFCECQDGGHSYSERWQRKGVRTRVLRYNSRRNEGGYHWRGLAASQRWLFGQLKRRQEGWSYRRLRQSIQGNNSEKNKTILFFF